MPSFIAMTTRLTVDKAGRIVLPKPVRDELRLGPGDTLDLVLHGDSITMRPARSRSPLQKEKGVWVYRTGHPLSASVIEETLRAVRAERVSRSLGKKQ